MPDALYIDTTGFVRITDKLKGMEKSVVESVDQVLNANAIEIATKAKQLAPVDIGGLRSSIAPETSQLLNKHITVNANYAAYVEFGTGSYAANYVGSLPDNWQQFAMQFKGKGGGNFNDLVLRIKEWIKGKRIDVFARKDLGQTIDIESGNISKKKKKRSRDEKEAQLDTVAYLIARKIVTEGIKAQPFLFPAYEQQRGQIEKDVETVLKSLS